VLTTGGAELAACIFLRRLLAALCSVGKGCIFGRLAGYADPAVEPDIVEK